MPLQWYNLAVKKKAIVSLIFDKQGWILKASCIKVKVDMHENKKKTNEDKVTDKNQVINL